MKRGEIWQVNLDPTIGLESSFKDLRDKLQYWWLLSIFCSMLSVLSYTTASENYSELSRFLLVSHFNLLLAIIGVWNLLKVSENPYEGFHFFIFIILLIQITVLTIVLGAFWIIGFLPCLV